MTPLSNIALVGVPFVGKAISVPIIATVGIPVAVGVGATLLAQHLLSDEQEEEDEQ